MDHEYNRNIQSIRERLDALEKTIAQLSDKIDSDWQRHTTFIDRALMNHAETLDRHEQALKDNRETLNGLHPIPLIFGPDVFGPIRQEIRELRADMNRKLLDHQQAITNGNERVTRLKTKIKKLTRRVKYNDL